MAPRVQVRDVSEMKVQDGSAAEDLSLVNFWTLTGETTSDKLMRLMQKRSDIRDSEIILSFEPMVAYKYVVVDTISDGDRKGIVLRSKNRLGVYIIAQPVLQPKVNVSIEAGKTKTTVTLSKPDQSSVGRPLKFKHNENADSVKSKLIQHVTSTGMWTKVELRYLVLMCQKKVIKRVNAETTLADLLACKKKDLGACLAHGKKVRSKF